MNGGGLFGGIGNALAGSGVSISPYGGQQTQGQWGYDQMLHQYGFGRYAQNPEVLDKPKRKKPSRPIEQVQAEVDEWLKDQGI